MMKKMVQCLLALTILLGVGASLSQPAEAGRGGRVAAGVAIGTLLGLGIAGAYDGPRHYYRDGGDCYRGPRQCHYVGRRCWYNRYDEYVCRGGDYRCSRPLICD
jgi:hypothetical protein